MEINKLMVGIVSVQDSGSVAVCFGATEEQVLNHVANGYVRRWWHEISGFAEEELAHEHNTAVIQHMNNTYGKREQVETEDRLPAKLADDPYLNENDAEIAALYFAIRSDIEKCDARNITFEALQFTRQKGPYPKACRQQKPRSLTGCGVFVLRVFSIKSID